MMTQAIIFDLGGVILDLNFKRMVDQFERLGVQNFAQYFTLQGQVDFFEQLELGQIRSETFFAKLRSVTNTSITDDQIREAWNLILTDFDLSRLSLLTELSVEYPLYLFSNTNAIHAAYFEKRCLEQTGHPLSYYFTKIYYSHELHLRKPTIESFKKVLEQAQLEAADTLFIDDNAANIAGAQAAGLRTHHLSPVEQLVDLDFVRLFY
ncbi:HAD-IA family hydrolase [Lactococcus taiwanensis]|uniref:HAD-IA family hydrolase n=1 Tax=Lactococcus taiwanensis TaxID=1151742 RepID=UPI0023F425A3|nr:HAD-IA family hydrolase [Lactococcus taiwanensis]